MDVKGIGINLNDAKGCPDILSKMLKEFYETGFDYIEISADALDVIYNGKLNRTKMKEINKVLNSFNLKYTVHSPACLDMRDMENLDVQKDLFKATIDFAAAVKSPVVISHFERKSAFGSIEKHFEEYILKMADYSKNLKILLCVENIEIDIISNVINLIRKANHPNLAMTLDIGHAYVASNFFGFDFFKAIELSKPFIRHLHISDNFGRFEPLRLENFQLYRVINHKLLLPLGLGDLHLPVGWGKIPYKKVFEIIDNYSGLATLEYRFERYKRFNKQILKKARAILQ